MTKNNGIKLVSLNIEGDRHLSAVREFLKREKADVVCLQEVFAENFEMFKSELNLKGEFFPTVNVVNKTVWAKNTKGFSGIGIFTNIKNAGFGSNYYWGKRELVPDYIFTQPNSGARVLAWIDFTRDGGKYRVITTHFTWSPKGEATNRQRTDIKKLLELLGKLENFVLCGDFNAPRGREIWSELAKKYKDNIPLEVKTTLDNKYHRVPGLRFVVDGLFSTLGYKINEVRVIGGISDHMAITAEISRML